MNFKNITGKLKNDEFSGKLIALLILLIAMTSIVYQFYVRTQIEKNRGETTGKIIEFIYEARLDYGIIYEYYVDKKHYTNQIGVSFFKCDNGKKGCVGEEFPVYYSKDNPENSRIDLGKYDKYQKKQVLIE